jgi:hypothetical protein
MRLHSYEGLPLNFYDLTAYEGIVRQRVATAWGFFWIFSLINVIRSRAAMSFRIFVKYEHNFR